MASTTSLSILLRYCLLALVLAQWQCTHSATMPKPKNAIAWSSHTYIVQTNHLAKPPQFDTLDRWYASMVATHSPRAATNSSSRIMYTYDTVMHGFAVALTGDEARAMARITGVLGVHEERVSRTQTTRSPTFLGLEPASGAWPQSGFGDGVIIGFVDGGIWPAHASFNDSGLGPVRPNWRTKCVDDAISCKCNRKLVGARSFIYGADGRLLSPVDTDGHATHVASTAAGSEVPGASFNGFAQGTAAGVAPKARVALYRACDVHGCPDSTLVAAIDAATRDGVDVLCLALAKDGTERPLHGDVVAVALFRAEQRGVFVVVPAGNSGPRPSTVTNVAPWVTTVGAATVDRVFPAKLNLGNGVVLIGQSLYSVRADGTRSVALVKSNCSEPDALTPDKVMGGVVVCRELDGELEVAVAAASRAGAAGIVGVDGLEWFAEAVQSRPFSLPGVVLAYTEAKMLEAYLASTAYPTASLAFACDTATGDNRAPIVAGFSSRGPAQEVEGIVKPDLVAPGVNILAAWPALPDGKEYRIMSGTSVASAHVAGVAALIKHQHADWTPAMVRSAMMTCTWTTDTGGEDILDSGVGVSQGNGTAATPLVAGAGLVRPALALDPGLVYDAGTEDYVDFLCSLNYTIEQVRLFEPALTRCTKTLPGGAAGLNYPSFVVVFDRSTRVITLTRTVTKVSVQAETYRARVAAPAGVKVTVTPSILKFSQLYERMSYTVQFESETPGRNGSSDFGHVSWVSWAHKVRSPVAFVWT